MDQKDSDPAPRASDILGSKEVLQGVVKKLSSQTLLFSLAIVVILVVTWMLSGKEGLPIVGAILFVFLVATSAYLFFEEKRKVEGMVDTPDVPARVSAFQSAPVQNPSVPVEQAQEFRAEVWVTAAISPAAANRDIGTVPTERRSEFRLGDKVMVHFRASRACYLTLLNIGASGKLTVLFPNAMYPDNFIAANQIYQIPGEKYGFDYVLQPPAGTEKLKAVATLDKLQLLESQFAPDGSLFRTVPSGAAARDMAILQKNADQVPKSSLAEANCEFRVAG